MMTGLLIVLFSVGTSINLGSLFNGKLSWLVATENVQITAVLLSTATLVLKWVKLKVYKMSDLFFLLMPFLLTALSLISQAMGIQKSSTTEYFQTSIHVFILYFLVCFAKQARLHFNTQVTAKFIVIVGIFEAVLGIVQHITGMTFFAPENLNAIYFLNGLSSSNVDTLGVGASVRAFGTFDSGLTLGIFLIFCLSVMIDLCNMKKYIKVVFTGVYLIAIYCTLTRNIYIGLISFGALYFFLKFNIRGLYWKWLYFIITFVTASLFWLNNLLGWLVSIASNANVSTFGSRFVFLRQVIEQIPDTWHFLLGSNLTSINGIPIDSSAITLIAQFGLLFTIFVFLLQGSIFGSVISSTPVRKPALGAFLFLFPIIGASNNVVQAFLIASIIICLFQNNDQYKSIKTG